MSDKNGNVLVELLACAFAVGVLVAYVGGIIHACRHHSLVAAVFTLSFPPAAVYYGAEAAWWHESPIKQAIAEAREGSKEAQRQVEEALEGTPLRFDAKSGKIQPPPPTKEEKELVQSIFEKAAARRLDEEEIAAFRRSIDGYLARTGTPRSFLVGYFQAQAEKARAAFHMQLEATRCLKQSLDKGEPYISSELTAYRERFATWPSEDRAYAIAMLETWVRAIRASAVGSQWTDVAGNVRPPVSHLDVALESARINGTLENIAALLETFQ